MSELGFGFRVRDSKKQMPSCIILPGSSVAWMRAMADVSVHDGMCAPTEDVNDDGRVHACLDTMYACICAWMRSCTTDVNDDVRVNAYGMM